MLTYTNLNLVQSNPTQEAYFLTYVLSNAYIYFSTCL